jgi:DNA-binding NtrC family response regulator
LLVPPIFLHELDAARHAQRREFLASVTAGPAPRPQSAPPAPAILLVDDVVLTRDFYSALLADHSFQVVVARGGAEGLALAQQHPLEAVILDIMMPEMPGLEVLERLHTQDPDLPVIMLTAFPSSRNAIAALKMGTFDFIVKGLSHELVLMAVHRAVRHRREVLARRGEVAQLLVRIAELEGSLPTP